MTRKGWKCTECGRKMRHHRGEPGQNPDDHHIIHSCKRCGTRIIVDRDTGEVKDIVRGVYIPSPHDLKRNVRREHYYTRISTHP